MDDCRPIVRRKTFRDEPHLLARRSLPFLVPDDTRLHDAAQEVKLDMARLVDELGGVVDCPTLLFCTVGIETGCTQEGRHRMANRLDRRPQPPRQSAALPVTRLAKSFLHEACPTATRNGSALDPWWDSRPLRCRPSQHDAQHYRSSVPSVVPGLYR
jgi:hypothetical protein